MKKKILYLAVTTALVLSSCSNDVTITEHQNLTSSDAISFRPLMNNMTRAVGITTDNLMEFYVTANNVSNPVSNNFGGETPATYTKSSTTYTCATKYYWPNSGNLDFIAFAPATGPGITRTDSTHFSVTPNASPASQQDFIYAVVRNQNRITNGSGVALNFRHTESKIIIQLKNTASDLNFTVKDVAIGYIKPTGAFAPVYKTADGSQSGFCTNGTAISNTTIATEAGYYITGSAWTASGTETSYSQTATTTSYPKNTTTAVALPSDMILIPQALTVATQYSAATAGAAFNGACIKVELKIQDNLNNYIIGTSAAEDYVTAIWPLAATTWLPGHQYTYTVDLSGGGYYETNQTSTDENLDPLLTNAEIKFVNVTVDSWIDGGTTNP